MKRGARLGRAVAVVVLAAAASGAAQAQGAACALTDSQFSDSVDALTGWASIRNHQQRYFPPCVDDGAYAQAHSELVARTLAARWNELPELHALIIEAPDFRAFVLRHVNVRSARADLQLVLSYTTFRCARRYGDFCREIREAAAGALERLR